MHDDEIIYTDVAKDELAGIVHPDYAKTPPDIIGRIEGNETDTASERSSTSQIASATVPFSAGVSGIAKVSIFESNGSMDEGGLTIRFTLENHGGAFLPHAELIKNGVDLHAAGEAESKALLTAVVQAATQTLTDLNKREMIATTDMI